MADLNALYEEYQIDRAYDNPEAYDGKYPPDWSSPRDDEPAAEGGRREAILDYQDGRCARCGRLASAVGSIHVHHYYELHEGGGNELENLVGLCPACHHLMHPWNDEMHGDYEEAPMFPAEDAQRRVATVRKPVTDAERDEWEDRLELLAQVSNTGENDHAISEATFDIGPKDSVRAESDCDEVLRPLTRSVTVHVENSDGPVEGAAIDLIYTHGQGSTDQQYTSADRTGADGACRFRIPKSVDEASYLVDHEGHPPVNGDVVLETDHASIPVALPESQADAGVNAGAAGAWNAVSDGGAASAGAGTAAGAGTGTASGVGAGATAGGSSGTAETQDSQTILDVAITAVLVPFYLLFAGVKWIVYAFLGIIALNVILGVPLLALKTILDVWTGSPFGLSGALEVLAVLGLFVGGTAWVFFWIGISEMDE